VLDVIGDALDRIKDEDGLTDADIGAVLGKSEDQAAKYRKGLTDMGLVSYARGKREWNGRFDGTLRRLCEESRPGRIDDRADTNKVLKAALVLSEALNVDDAISTEDVRANRSTLERARDAIEAQLTKLKPEAAA